MIERLVNILKNNSFFLFGARGTGKTRYLQQLFGPQEALYIDLLDPGVYAELQAYPERLGSKIQPAIELKKWILLDEVQRIPELLNVVHQLIEKSGAMFALTGSSARKLRRGASNLLAGRAFVYRLFPLLASEIGKSFNLERALAFGTLPKSWTVSDDMTRAQFLKAYAETYLQEEIVAEQIVRNLPPFRRFLAVAAQSNTKILNFARIGRDINGDPSNVKNYYQILEDTLLGFFLEPFHRSVRKRQTMSPKFYLFDTGVVRALAQMVDLPLSESTYEYGRLFESFLINQIRSQLEYQYKQYQLSYLTTKDGAEIDLIVERAGAPTLLIEVKSATNINETDVRAVATFGKDIAGALPLCFYRGSERLKVGSVEVLPWQTGLREYI